MTMAAHGIEYAKKQGEIGETVRDMRGIKRRDKNENVLAWPNGLRENAGTAISCRGPGPAERRKRYTSSRDEEEVDAQMCPCGKARESETHIVGECEMYKEEQD